MSYENSGGAERRISEESGIPPGKKMEHTVDIRGIADIAQLRFKVEKTTHAIHFHRKGRAIGEVIDQGVDLAEVNGIYKNSFHGHSAA